MMLRELRARKSAIFGASLPLAVPLAAQAAVLTDLKKGEMKLKKGKEKQAARGQWPRQTLRELISAPIAAPATAPTVEEKNFERDKKRG